VGFAGGSGGKESANGLGEERGRFHKKLARCNRNGASRDRDIGLLTFLSLSRGRDSLSVGGSGLRGNIGGRSPAGVKVARGPSGTGGVFPCGEFIRFPGVGVLLGKRLRFAIYCGRGS